MKYLDKKFSSPANSRAFVDNWDTVFNPPPEHVEPQRENDRPVSGEPSSDKAPA